MKEQRFHKGLRGEAQAARFLKDEGYEILAHNWRDPEFRIQVDLVVRRSERAYIVEVKNHRWTGSGFEQLMTSQQREKLLQFARRLHSARYKNFRWAFLWIWVREEKCQIVELIEF